MSGFIQSVHEKAAAYREKYNDEALYNDLLDLAGKLEEAEMLKHHFGYFVMHAQAIVPHGSRPPHFQEALTRAKKILEDPSEA